MQNNLAPWKLGHGLKNPKRCITFFIFLHSLRQMFYYSMKCIIAKRKRLAKAKLPAFTFTEKFQNIVQHIFFILCRLNKTLFNAAADLTLLWTWTLFIFFALFWRLDLEMDLGWNGQNQQMGCGIWHLPKKK